MPSRKKVDDLVTAQNNLVAGAQKDLKDLWPHLATDPNVAREQLKVAYLDIVERFGNAAAALAADWFEDLTGLDAVLAAEIDVEATKGSAGWAMSKPFKTGDIGTGLAAAQSAAEWLIKQPARNTVKASSERHGLAYARVPSGPDTCAWCTVLASRGFVYATRESAGGGEGHGTDLDRFHRGCDCQIVPNDGSAPAGYNPEALYDEYDRARTQVEADGNEPTMKNIAAKMRSTNPERYTDGTWGKRPKGKSKDGSVDRATFWDYRKQARKWLHSNGYVIDGDEVQAPPKTMPEAPEWWPHDDSAIPELTTKQWLHTLYAFSGGGGHLHGFEWAKEYHQKAKHTVFPRDWTPKKIARAAESVLRANKLSTGRRDIAQGTIDGIDVAVLYGPRKGGGIHVISIYPAA